MKAEQSKREEGERESLGNARQRERERERERERDRELAMEVQSLDSRPNQKNNQHLGSSEGGLFDSSQLITWLQVLPKTDCRSLLPL